MSDLRNQLRRYIDGLGDPVSLHETTTAAPRRQYRAPAAILAGAAIVLIPALVLVGIRLWPTDGEIGRPTTVPPIVTSSTTVPPSTTTTADAPAPIVNIPDIVGLTEGEARQILEDLGLELTVTETYLQRADIGLIQSQSPEPGDDAAPGSTVAVGIAIAPTCDSASTSPAQPGDGEMLVTFFVECAPDSQFPNFTSPVTRIVPEGANTIEATLNALLAGLSDSETATGLRSSFGAETATALASVRLDGSALTVDFNDDILVGTFSTSTGSLFFMSELEANLFQFDAVDSIEFQLNGSCESFYNYLQGSCEIQTRDDWDAKVALWDAERALQPSPGTELTADTVVGEVFTADDDPSGRRVLHLTDGRQVDSGFTEMRSWALDDPTPTPAVDDTAAANWVSHVSGLNTEMLWLVSSAEPYGEVPTVYEVQAALEIPWDEIAITADPFVMNGAQECRRNAVADPTLVVVTQLDPAGFEVTGATIPLRAWEIDIERAKFDEVPLDGIDCIFERS